LSAAFRAEQTATLERLGDTPLAEVASLAAWRQAFRAFGVKPTQHRPAAEALLRRLTKKGGIPNLNRLVDLGNLVSIRYAMPVAVFDTREATGTVTVRFAEGRERFTELGSQETKHPDPGEVIFVDDADLISARRWCWRQSAQSAALESTTEALITVEGHHDKAETEVRAAVDDLLALLAEFAGGIHQAAVLSADNPEFEPK
jgi:DNA/RNA-binding domain of Phe-tRNA-synthetase-like protein